MKNTEQLKAATEAMVNWLSHPNELGVSPQNIICTDEFNRNNEHFYVFKYQKTEGDKWLVGVCGGYESPESLEHTGKVFSSFQEYSNDAVNHATQMVEAIEDYWKRENESWNEYFLKPDEIQQLIDAIGYCFASHKIVKEGMKVGYMYREEPDDKNDSGWRFFSGTENQDYVDVPTNIGIFDVNTIANYDKAIIPYLSMDSGTELQRIADSDIFRKV